jgi:hypothetical protein
MRRPPVSLLPAALSALLVFAFGAARAGGGATGSITMGDETWPVGEALAVLDGEDLSLVFAKHAFDRTAWAEDGKFDSSDLLEFKDDADAVSLTIDIDEDDGSYGGHTQRFSAGSMSGGFSSDLEQSVALTARDDKHVAGTITFDDGDGLVAKLTFDLPILRSGEAVARPGTALGAGGGEPGKALQAMVDATHAGDLDRMIALSAPERRAGIEQAKAAGEAKEMLRMAQLFTPKITRITGGTVDGDKAWVDFDGKESDGAVKGTAELERVDGGWYLTNINTRSGG